MKLACSMPQGSTENDAKSNFSQNIYSESIMEKTLTKSYFRRICSLFLISILNIYIYMKFEELRDNQHNFWRNAKLASRENYASKEIKCTIFYNSSSDNVNCHSVQATISWGSPGEYSMIDCSSGDAFWGFVLPVLEYCSAVSCSAADTHLKGTVPAGN